MIKSLQYRHHPLSVVAEQVNVLQQDSGVARFEDRLQDADAQPLQRTALTTLQVNVGKMCNQTCKHCHVDAGPDRTEIMTRETMTQCLALLDRAKIATVDITGGAPEMNPHFRWFVEEIRKRDIHVIDRCNLTILTVPAYADMVGFLARHRVEIVASLPYYLEDRTDAQRGDGVFAKSIRALQMLNEAGYADAESGLVLNLVYNPVGAFLPPRQELIEADYRRELLRRHDIRFDNLFTITNLPISRFLDYLLESGNYADYMQRLANAYNPATIDGLMCRSTLSVGWDGKLYDCDFNQMLELPIGTTPHISEIDIAALDRATIATGQHCYGCTAGAGSSCGGALQ